jgi:hypothetical protein
VFVKRFIPAPTANSSGPDVQPLLTQLMLDGKPLGQQQRMAVSWSKNRVNESTGRVSYKHKLQISDAVLALLPAGVYVHTVKATGRDSITVNCCRPKQDRRPQPQQVQQKQQKQQPHSSSSSQQAPVGSQHTQPTLSAGKRSAVQAAMKVTTAAAKRQRSHHQPGLAGQHNMLGMEDSYMGLGNVPAGQRQAAAAGAAGAAGAAMGAAGTAQQAGAAAAAGSEPQPSAGAAEPRTSIKKYSMVSKQHCSVFVKMLACAQAAAAATVQLHVVTLCRVRSGPETAST